MHPACLPLFPSRPRSLSLSLSLPPSRPLSLSPSADRRTERQDAARLAWLAGLYHWRRQRGRPVGKEVGHVACRATYSQNFVYYSVTAVLRLLYGYAYGTCTCSCTRVKDAHTSGRAGEARRGKQLQQTLWYRVDHLVPAGNPLGTLASRRNHASMYVCGLLVCRPAEVVQPPNMHPKLPRTPTSRAGQRFGRSGGILSGSTAREMKCHLHCPAATAAAFA